MSLRSSMERSAGSFGGSVVITVAARRSGGVHATGISLFAAAEFTSREVLRRSERVYRPFPATDAVESETAWLHVI